MPQQQKELDLFKTEARRIFIMNAPWLPAGQRIGINVAKYTEFKDSVADKIMAIDDKEKLSIIAGLQDDLDFMIRWNHKED
jgi:hypothetical protein